MIGDVFPGEWARDAECQKYDPDLWFPDPSVNPPTPATEEARWGFALSVCREDCPVIAECLEFVMRMEASTSARFRAGVWGGLTPEARAALYRKRVRNRCPDGRR